MSDPIKAGDVVRLKSGGSKMTVTHVDEHLSMCSCAWFLNGDIVFTEIQAAALTTDLGTSTTRFIG